MEETEGMIPSCSLILCAPLEGNFPPNVVVLYRTLVGRLLEGVAMVISPCLGYPPLLKHPLLFIQNGWVSSGSSLCKLFLCLLTPQMHIPEGCCSRERL